MSVDSIDADFGHWLAGLVDGEGSFIVSNGRGVAACEFQLGLRADDRLVLEQAAEATGLGGVSLSKNGRWNPMAYWVVKRKAETAELVRLFDRFPLRAKKARDYAIWREAVLLWQDKSGNVVHNNHPWGAGHHATKLSAEDVAEILTEWEAGATQTALAARYGVTQGHLSNIITGKRARADGLRAIQPDPTRDRMLELREELRLQRVYQEAA